MAERVFIKNQMDGKDTWVRLSTPTHIARTNTTEEQ